MFLLIGKPDLAFVKPFMEEGLSLVSSWMTQERLSHDFAGMVQLVYKYCTTLAKDLSKN